MSLRISVVALSFSLASGPENRPSTVIFAFDVRLSAWLRVYTGVPETTLSVASTMDAARLRSALPAVEAEP